MSLFDVIKYRISTPPTLEELDMLPRDLLINFLMDVGWNSVTYINEEVARKESIKENLSSIIHEYVAGAFPKDIPVLRKMIRDYDEPI